MHAIQSASSLVRCVFRGPRARALFAGLAAHSIVALDQPGTSAIGLALAAAVTLRVGQSHAVARNKLRRRWRPCSDRSGESSNLDWALDGIPWRNPECARAGTVHLGGTIEEIAAGEAAAWDHKNSPAPFVLIAQPSLFDPTRAPAGRHTAWAYCHVPNA
jgi:phytoene dehydrogenase-like protein